MSAYLQLMKIYRAGQGREDAPALSMRPSEGNPGGWQLLVVQGHSLDVSAGPAVCSLLPDVQASFQDLPTYPLFHLNNHALSTATSPLFIHLPTLIPQSLSCESPYSYRLTVSIASFASAQQTEKTSQVHVHVRIQQGMISSLLPP